MFIQKYLQSVHKRELQDIYEECIMKKKTAHGFQKFAQNNLLLNSPFL